MTVAELIRVLVGLPMVSEVEIDLPGNRRVSVDGAFCTRGVGKAEISFVQTQSEVDAALGK